MSQYDRIVEWTTIDSSSRNFYLNVDTGEIFYSLEDYVKNTKILKKYLTFATAYGGNENEYYPTGNCYLVINVYDNKNEEIQSIDDMITEKIITPGSYNNCLFYAVILAHPNLLKNINDVQYIQQLKKQFMEYATMRFMSDDIFSDIGQYDENISRYTIETMYDIISNIQIPKHIKNQSNIFGYYFSDIMENDDKYFPSVLFDICQNNIVDVQSIGKYMAEFFGVNIKMTSEYRGSKQKFVENYGDDEENPQISIILNNNHFSAECKSFIDDRKCYTTNI